MSALCEAHVPYAARNVLCALLEKHRGPHYDSSGRGSEYHKWHGFYTMDGKPKEHPPCECYWCLHNNAEKG